MSRAKNTIKLSDISSTPIKVLYSASYASQSLLDSGITTNRGTNISPSASMSSINRTRMSNYRVIRQLYYQPYLTGSLLNSASYFSPGWESSTAASGTFDDTNLTFITGSSKSISFLAIPALTFGEQISRNTFNLSSTNNTSYRIIDDGNGNIVDSFSGSAHVGNIFYAQGIVTVTNNDYVGILLNNNFTITSSVIPPTSATPSLSVTPSITVTPSISRTPTTTPSVSITPSITLTRTVSISPTISQTVSASPTMTPSISITPSVSMSPSLTPSVTVSRTPSTTPSLYSVTVDIGFENTVTAPPSARFWYKFGPAGTWTEIGTSTKTPVCNTTATQGTITNIPAGTSLHLGVQADSVDINFGVNGCAGTALDYCGQSDPYFFTVNSNSSVVLKVAISGGDYILCP